LHADHPSQLKILVRQGKLLEIDGADLSIKPLSLKIPRREIRHEGRQAALGMTIMIAKTELRVMLRAKNPASDTMPTFTATLPIDEKVRQRLLTSRNHCLPWMVGNGSRRFLTKVGGNPDPRPMPEAER